MKGMEYLTFVIMIIIGVIMMYITYSTGYTLYEGLVSKIGRPSFLFFCGSLYVYYVSTRYCIRCSF